MAKEQLQVLNVLDLAKTQLYHFTIIVIAGMGFFTDAYDLFSLPNVAASVTGVALVGTLVGQLFFGWLGFGIGGDYPLLATITSEYANKKTRGAFIAAVFAMQGFGILASGIVALIVSSAFDHAYKAPTYSVGPVASTVCQADYIWLIVLIQNLFQKDIFTAIGWIPSAAIALCSTVPGYWFTVAFINIMGRFANCNSTYGFLLHDRVHVCNRYPMPSQDNEREKYWVERNISRDRKGRCYCWCIWVLYAAQSQDSKKTDARYPSGIDVKNSLIVLSCINFLGMLFTFCVQEPQGKSLEELSGENEDNSGVPSKQQADSSRTTTV
ncbi:hypothetical protein HYC85_019508 [Camellia sinensis]|uniref:Major facilitator superfamily (MFS) profile domain-containing protein n=1 Tax=Camellia sinensis TaxID=4442 RepID=A0A7J7GQT6_CAMSI|nr:hypothetical protein HYC85_019508 [Camellia sinensis]